MQGNATGFGQILQALNADSGATGTYAPAVVTGATGLAGNPNLTNQGTPISNNGTGVVLDLLPAAEQTTVKNVPTNVPYSYWTLVAVQANNLFPVGEGSVSNAGDIVTVDLVNGLYDQTNPPYGVTWIDPTTSTAPLPPYVNAWSFIKEIQANPNGPLAQQWVAANQAGLASTSVTAITNSINSFFQSTHSYQNVTSSIYTWVNSYLNTFANAWANFEDSYTYYASTSPDSDAIHAGKTIVFTKSSTYPSVNDSNGMTNANGGYTIVYDNDTTLYFCNGQLRDDLTTDTPKICLQCTYTSLQQITNKTGDANIFYPMLTGTIYGEQVICLAWRPGGWKRTENAFDKALGWRYTKLLLLGINVWMCVDFIVEKCKGWKENREQKEEAKKKAAEEEKKRETDGSDKLTDEDKAKVNEKAAEEKTKETTLQDQDLAELKEVKPPTGTGEQIVDNKKLDEEAKDVTEKVKTEETTLPVQDQDKLKEVETPTGGQQDELDEEAQKKAAELKNAGETTGTDLSDNNKPTLKEVETQTGKEEVVVDRAEFNKEVAVKEQESLTQWQQANPDLKPIPENELLDTQKQNQATIEQENKEFETTTEDAATNEVKKTETKVEEVKETVEPEVVEKINEGEDKIENAQKEQLDNAQEQLDEDMQYQNTSQERQENSEIKQEQNEINNESDNPKDFVEQSAGAEKNITSTTSQVVETSNAEGAELNEGTQAEINKVNEVDEQVTDDKDNANEKIDEEKDGEESGEKGVADDLGKISEDIHL